MERKLIIISGAPGSGKTTISRFLAERFRLPCVNRDAIKELLFDNLRVVEENRRYQYGKGSTELLAFMAGKLLETGHPFIVEGNFENRYATPHFRELWEGLPFRVLQIICRCEFEILYERFSGRVREGNRHPGHDDRRFEKEVFRRYLRDKVYELELPESTLLRVDTSSLDDPGREELAAAAADFLEGRALSLEAIG